MCACMPACVRACVRARASVRTRMRACVRVCVRACICVHTCVHTCLRARALAWASACGQASICPSVRTRVRRQAYGDAARFKMVLGRTALLITQSAGGFVVYLRTADGMPIARVRACRYSKKTASGVPVLKENRLARARKKPENQAGGQAGMEAGTQRQLGRRGVRTVVAKTNMLPKLICRHN